MENIGNKNDKKNDFLTKSLKEVDLSNINKDINENEKKIKINDIIKDKINLNGKKYTNLDNKIKIRIYKAIYCLIFILLIISQNKNKIKDGYIRVCLCTIGKKENLYINEYLNHYLKIGYDHVFLYDNNDIGDEKFEDVISKDLIGKFVTIIDYRGIKGKHVPRSYEAYNDCYSNNKKSYDWLSFFDLDEFLEFNNSQNLQKFFGDEKFDKCQNIKINWIMFSDNDLLYYENKSLEKRFPIPLFNDPSNRAIKSTVRGNLKGNYWKRRKNPHTSKIKVTNCNSKGEIVSYYNPFVVPPTHENAYIKHYAVKTIEEYCNKIKRGYPDYTVVYDDKMMKFFFDFFFLRAKKTKEKLDYIKKIFNYTYIY